MATSCTFALHADLPTAKYMSDSYPPRGARRKAYVAGSNRKDKKKKMCTLMVLTGRTWNKLIHGITAQCRKVLPPAQNAQAGRARTFPPPTSPARRGGTLQAGAAHCHARRILQILHCTSASRGGVTEGGRRGREHARSTVDRASFQPPRPVGPAMEICRHLLENWALGAAFGGYCAGVA